MPGTMDLMMPWMYQPRVRAMMFLTWGDVSCRGQSTKQALVSVKWQASLCDTVALTAASSRSRDTASSQASSTRVARLLAALPCWYLGLTPSWAPHIAELSWKRRPVDRTVVLHRRKGAFQPFPLIMSYLGRRNACKRRPEL